MGAAGGKQHMMQVKYKRSRGGEVEGEEVTTNKAWCIEVLQNDHEATAAYFNSIPEENKNEILELFEGDNVFESPGAAQSWINSKDEEELEDIVNSLKEMIGSGGE